MFLLVVERGYRRDSWLSGPLLWKRGEREREREREKGEERKIERDRGGRERRGGN